MNRRDLNVVPIAIPSGWSPLPSPLPPHGEDPPLTPLQVSHIAAPANAPPPPAPQAEYATLTPEAPQQVVKVQPAAYHHKVAQRKAMLLNSSGSTQYGILAYSGVFTPDGSNFPYTQPLLFNASQNSAPQKSSFLDFTVMQFIQLYNNYRCATIPISAQKFAYHYSIFFGGISMARGINSTGSVSLSDSLFKIPLTNDVSVIEHQLLGPLTLAPVTAQYLLPSAASTATAGLTSFGAESQFFRTIQNQDPNAALLPLNLDDPAFVPNQEVQVGYIVGGIDSTDSDFHGTNASSRIYKVFLTKLANPSK